MRNESLIWILALQWPSTTQLPFCIKCTHPHQTTAKWLRMWKTAIPSLFKSPNLSFSKPSISVQIDKVIQSITISTEISKNRTRFSSNATKTRWFKFTEWWQRDGTKGFPRPEFYEHEKHVSTALGLQCSSTAAPSRPLLWCHLQLAAFSVAFSCLFYKPPLWYCTIY